MRYLALLLSLILSLDLGCARLTFTAEKSDVLSAEALTALSTLLDETELTASPAGYDVTAGGELLLWARLNGGEGAVVCGDAALPLAGETAQTGGMRDAQRELGELLKKWEESSAKTADLKEAGTARRQLVYTLSAAEWTRIWPRVTETLRAYVPAAAELEKIELLSKGIFKRYFDKEGQEIGAYFYAEKARMGEETRELRLEYGWQPDKGLYLVFRCPDPKGKNNLRIALHAKYNGTGWTLNGEMRHLMDADADVYTLSGKTNGKITLGLSRKRDGRAVPYEIVLQPGEKSAAYTYFRSKRLVLSGAVRWQKAELPERTLPEAMDTEEAFSAALAARLLPLMTSASPEGWQQLLHYLATDALIRAQGEEKTE